MAERALEAAAKRGHWVILQVEHVIHAYKPREDYKTTNRIHVKSNYFNRAFHNIHCFKSVVNVYNFLISLFLKVAFSRLEFGD